MTRTTDVKVVALCGVTCSGKTSLARLLVDHYRKVGNSCSSNQVASGDVSNLLDSKVKGKISVEMILMDDYFLSESDPRHKLVEELNHINWELMTSLDIDKMVGDVTSAIERLRLSGSDYGLLIVDGFLVLNCEKLKSLCDVKFFMDLDYSICLLRRNNRVYDPPDVPGYFEKVVWPESQINKESALKSTPNVQIIDGSLPLEVNVNKISEYIDNIWLNSK